MPPIIRHFFLGSLIVLVACRTQGPTTLSVDEAKEIAVSVRTVDYQPPPRTVDDLNEIMGSLPAATYDCTIVHEDRRFDIERLVERISGSNVKSVWLQSLLVRSGAEFTRGNFRRTLALLDTAVVAAGSTKSYIGGVSMKGNILVQKTIVLAAIRELDAAQASLDEARSAFRWSSGGTSELLAPDLLEDYPATWSRLLLSLGEAAVRQARDDLTTAEFYYRDAIRAGTGTLIRYNYYDHARLAMDLSLNLMQQGRLAESELVVRAAAKRALTDFNPQARYTAQTAELVAQLARVLLEQGRLDDAENMARSAVHIHELDCSLLGSLGYMNARKVLASVLAAQGEWQSVVDQFHSIRNALSNQTQDFARLFGDNVDWGLAMVYTGEASAGLEQLERALVRTTERHGATSYEAAEVRGLLAMARDALGLDQTALDDFRAALPALVEGRDQLATTTGGTVRSQRAARIIDGYVDLLDRVHTNGTAGLPAEISEELFRVTSAAHISSVQRALAAAAARSSPADPKLASLVRQEQNAAQEMNSLVGTLTYIEAASDRELGSLRIQELRERVVALRAARVTLVNEIRNLFPEFSQLMTPGPTTVTDVRVALRDGESMLATYTTQHKTYVWAIPKRGAIGFVVVPLGSSELEQIVKSLRAALAPDIGTLMDIPDFDLETAYGLYADLFEPVEPTLKEITHLIYVPRGVLATLPISLLPTKATETPSANGALFQTYRKVPWLVRRHTVSVFPSLASFRIHRATSTAAAAVKPFAGFGDPVFGGNKPSDFRGILVEDISHQVDALAQNLRHTQVTVRAKPRTRSSASASLASLPSLPETRDEILEIGAALGAEQQRDIFLGLAASEEQIKAMSNDGRLARYRIIAFATHALVPGDLDGLLEPALALSKPAIESNEDGLLGVGDILGLSINADWVVLSACNTAAAQGAGAEAVSGLGRAFFYSGARSLLVSNWPVETTSTKELTTTIFKLQEVSPDLSRAEALQRAMIRLIDHGGYRDDTGRLVYSYAHPIFWAPFTLVGDGGQVSMQPVI